MCGIQNPWTPDINSHIHVTAARSIKKLSTENNGPSGIFLIFRLDKSSFLKYFSNNAMSPAPSFSIMESNYPSADGESAEIESEASPSQFPESEIYLEFSPVPAISNIEANGLNGYSGLNPNENMLDTFDIEGKKNNNVQYIYIYIYILFLFFCSCRNNGSTTTNINANMYKDFIKLLKNKSNTVCFFVFSMNTI